MTTSLEQPGAAATRRTGTSITDAYHSGPTNPRLRVERVATGGLQYGPEIPGGVRNAVATHSLALDPTVLVLDLGDAKFETETLLDLLMPLAREIRAGRYGDVVLVVATAQDSVARVAEMLAATHDLPLYVTTSSSGGGFPQEIAVDRARPVGRLTTTERESLAALDHMGGRVTANAFAAATALELTAAGNRLSNLARRGYVHRVARSRREGDEYVGLAWFGPDRDRGARTDD